MKNDIINIISIFLLYIVSANALGCCMGCKSVKYKHTYYDDNYKYVKIANVYIEMPLGYFALVKIDGEPGIAAIRLLEEYSHQFGDVTYHHDVYGDEYRFDFAYIKYECYYIVDANAKDFLSKNAYYKKKKINFRSMLVIGRCIMPLALGGNIECKNIILGTTADRRIGFNGSGLKIDKRILVAPTKWKDIKDVRLDDPHIKWYRYVEDDSQNCPEYEKYKKKHPRYNYYIYEVPVEELW